MTTNAPSRTTRAALALAVTAALTAGGCATRSPVTTDASYAAGDGVNLDVGDVGVRGLLLVADAAGGPATVVGQVVNNGSSDTDVTFAVGSATAKATVPASSAVSLSSGTDRPTLAALTQQGKSVGPGQIVTVQVRPSGGEVGSIPVPVLAATDYYASLKPTAPPSSSGSSSAPSSSSSG